MTDLDAPPAGLTSPGNGMSPSIRRVLTFGLGALVAAWPAVATGWSAASAMNLESEETIRAAVQLPVAIGLASLASLGGLHALWRRA